MSTMTEREMLELAAKACGMTVSEALGKIGRPTCTYSRWNPLDDDGDALRLAETLGMTLCMDGTGTVSAHNSDEDGIQEVFITQEIGKTGRISAARLAIVRAAAEIGRSKHE